MSFSTMTGTERVLTVLHHQEPDRIPTFEWDIDVGVIKAMTGQESVEGFVEAMDHDAVITRPDYSKTPLGDNLYRNEWGVVIQKSPEHHDMPIHAQAPIKTWEDFERWQMPAADAPGRFETLKRYIQRFKGKKAIFIQTRDVFAHPRDLLGYEQFLVDCLQRPDLVRAIVDKTVEHSIRVVQIAAELGAEVVMTGDDIADKRSTLISPRVWENLFLPAFRRFVAGIHDAGLMYWKHSDGNLMKVMDGIVEAGIDGIDPVDPLAGMDLATFKQRWGSRVAIKGNVDCAYLLVTGSEEQVVKRVRECIRIAGPGGGYALSSSNTIHSGVRPELYRAMLRTLREDGVYPLKI